MDSLRTIHSSAKILSTRESASCIVVIDDCPAAGDLYSAVLSIAMAGTVVVGQHIRRFHRFAFFLTMPAADRQLAAACATAAMVPYAYSDYEFVTREIILRVLLHRHFASAAIGQYRNAIPSFLPQVITVMERHGLGHLHFFFALLRSIENIWQKTVVDLTSFFFWKMREMCPSTIETPPFLQHFEFAKMATAIPARPFLLAPVEKAGGFQATLASFIHLFFYRVSLTPPALEFVAFMIEVLLRPGVHAVVFNDLKLDYELLTQFSASTVAAQFRVFHSLQQLPALVAESAASPHPIIFFCRKPDAALVRLAASGVETCDLPTLYACLTNSVFIEHLENTRGSECCFPYAPFSTAAAAAAAATAAAAAAPVHNISPTDSFSIIPALSQPQVVTHRVHPTELTFLLLHFAKTIHIVTLCAETDDVALPLRPAFTVWDRSASLPNTTNPLMMRLFQLRLTGGERAMVRVGPQLQVVLARFEFLVRRINQFIDQRHRFIQQVLVVKRAIEQALTDTAEVIASTTP
jgi:hypothetical protein